MLRPDDLSWYRGHSKSRSEGSGIIQVSSRFLPTRTVSDELEALNQIPQFQPLIPTTVSSQSFNWGGLFAPSQRRLPGTAAGLDPRSSTALLEKCRRHIQRCADNVARDQKILIDSISNMDEYCAKLANTVAHRSHQAKVQGEKLSSITIIRDVAHKTRLALSSVLISLDKLELLLPPEARLSQLKSKYPALAKAMTQNNSSIPAVRSL
ncbi:hypothetical protein BC832DRAFT_595453 [Gaertneriomyces semiglobifer]|nr:hypothetical protein BC832DRAFT_595453 [Gaertneriomyces semiglobifer]